jgi:hypothetical protein
MPWRSHCGFDQEGADNNPDAAARPVNGCGKLRVCTQAIGLAEEVAVALYGRDDQVWDEFARAGLEFLIERARLGKLTSYSELNATLTRRTGLPGFDFSRADERAAMGHLLYLTVELNRPATGLMISALVTYLDANDAGSGFYGYAQDLGMLQRNASVMQKLEFWASQVKALHKYYAPTRPR